MIYNRKRRTITTNRVNTRTLHLYERRAEGESEMGITRHGESSLEGRKVRDGRTKRNRSNMRERGGR